MNTTPPPKKRHRVRLVFFVVVIVGLWRLAQRPAPLAHEPSESEGAGGPRSLREEPQAPTERPQHQEPDAAPTPAESGWEAELLAPTNGAAPLHRKLTEARYAVTWVDSSAGNDVRHEKRDLTLEQAAKEAGWLVRHNRRFYPGALAARSPFSRLRVLLQCACGRDVVDLREPHTFPGEDRICPYSGSEAMTGNGRRPAGIIRAGKSAAVGVGPGG